MVGPHPPLAHRTWSAGFVSFLVGYSALLGPVAGVIMADYFLVR